MMSSRPGGTVPLPAQASSAGLLPQRDSVARKVLARLREHTENSMPRGHNARWRWRAACAGLALIGVVAAADTSGEGKVDVKDEAERWFQKQSQKLLGKKFMEKVCARVERF